MACPTAFSSSASGKTTFIMEIPSRYPPGQRSSLDLPEILVYGSSPSDPYRSLSRPSSNNSKYTPTSSSQPMSIPSSRDPPPPPPLPPPRYPNLVSHENFRQGNSPWEPPVSVPQGSSLNGSGTNRGNSVTIRSISEEDARRDAFPNSDEGYGSASVGSSLLV